MNKVDYDIDKLHAKALKAEPGTRTFFYRLKKQKIKRLDLEIREIHQNVFESIDCLACANCCRDLGPRITQKDIVRISKTLKMKAVDFIDQYLRTDEDNDYVFKEMPCPFLAADNYCFIYPDRPKACRDYPHTDRKKFHQLFDLTIKNTFVCPAVFEIVDQLKKKV